MVSYYGQGLDTVIIDIYTTFVCVAELVKNNPCFIIKNILNSLFHMGVIFFYLLKYSNLLWDGDVRSLRQFSVNFELL